MKKILYLLRKNIVLVFTLSSYILTVYFFFFDLKILFWLLFAIIFFLFAHYFIIEIKKTQIVNLLLIVSVITLFLLVMSWFHNFFYAFWLVFLNLWVFFLFWTIYDEVYNRIEISSYNLFTRGVKIYTIFLSITFALSFLWTYKTFDLTCPQISSFTTKFAQNILGNVWIKTQNISNVKLKDIANYIWKDSSSLSWKNFLLTWSNLTWVENKSFSNITFSSLVSIDFWKNVVLNQIMQNKKLLDKNVCEIIVWKIKKEYQKPGFQFTVIFLIFMLFYPIILLTLFILSFLNFILFKLMNLFNIYKFKTVVEDVELIE